MDIHVIVDLKLMIAIYIVYEFEDKLLFIGEESCHSDVLGCNGSTVILITLMPFD